MRMRSVLKIVSLAAAVALLMGGPEASARMLKKHPPPDACVFHRHVIAAGTICSYNCDPKSLWCSQQICSGGKWSAALSCQGIFCLRRCG